MNNEILHELYVNILYNAISQSSTYCSLAFEEIDNATIKICDRLDAAYEQRKRMVLEHKALAKSFARVLLLGDRESAMYKLVRDFVLSLAEDSTAENETPSASG